MMQAESRSDEAIRRTVIETYGRCGFLSALYTRIRFALAPMLATAAYVPPEGDIVDLGCGHGIFALVVHLRYPERNIMGIDKNGARISIANKIMSSPHLRFVAADVEDVDWQDTAVITIVDLLHHMPFEAQNHLLQRVARRLPPGGFVLIKDLQKRPTWKYWWHYLQDSLSYRGRLYFRSAEEMVRVLQDNDFSVRVVDLAARSPYPHTLYLCTKIGQTA